MYYLPGTPPSQYEVGWNIKVTDVMLVCLGDRQSRTEQDRTGQNRTAVTLCYHYLEVILTHQQHIKGSVTAKTTAVYLLICRFGLLLLMDRK